ncbi:MAG: hypothetical protein O7C75_10970, partial [Verrucomicrobia bacterium]|nr:hypothetical protein [Verrucomicrobiota bacterium]
MKTHIELPARNLTISSHIVELFYCYPAQNEGRDGVLFAPMANDPQIIAHNRSELQKLKEERMQEEVRVARLQKEAVRIAAEKEDLEVERVIISESQRQLKTKQEELNSAQTEIEQTIEVFEREKKENLEELRREQRALEESRKQLDKQESEVEGGQKHLQEEIAQWEKQKEFDVEQLKTAQKQFEQKRSREENEFFGRKKSLQAQEDFQHQKSELLSKRE